MPKRTAEGVTGAIDGKLYVLPGVCCSEFVTEPIRELYRYDPVTNTWVTRRSAPNYHRQGGAAVLGGKFYVVGGYANSIFSPAAHLDVYDPKRNTWRSLAPMPTAGVATATALQGKLFVVAAAFENGASVVRTYAYNPTTNTWKTLAPIPQHTFANTAITLVRLDGKPRVFALNGHGVDSGETVPSYLYTP